MLLDDEQCKRVDDSQSDETIQIQAESLEAFFGIFV